MTQEERENPKILNGSRRRRIAQGSGSNIQEVNQLIKQFGETQKMMKMMSGGKGKNLMRAMSNMNKMPGR
jgi:signal recognition particle subunit SRP54